ncbi:MAG TPA: DUF969 domain-containing protein [Caulobacteraceae bacterium]|jgi:uncharacterized membrane protein
MEPNYWTLLGIAVVVAGFVARLNPLLVVTAAALVTGLIGGLGPLEVVAAFGKAFNENRYVSIIWLVLPVIGLLEREGLQERARQLIARFKAATTGRLLLLYLVVRQATAAIGLTSLGGHAQMVRPLIAPMAEGAAENRLGDLPDPVRHRIRAFAAATDNVGVFFGEDIFIAFASILLIKAFLEQNGLVIEPLHLSVWAIPTAVCALLIHGTRLLLLDRRLRREAAEHADGGPP